MNTHSDSIVTSLATKNPPSTLISLSTQTSIPSTSWTPMPTLQAEEARELILDMLITNAGCELPCWWGFDPRSTEWSKAVKFFDTLDAITLHRSILKYEGDDYDIVTLYVNPPGLKLNIEYYTSGEKINRIWIITEMRRESDFEYDYNNPDYFHAMQNYTIDQILKIYGMPEQVWIKSFPPAPVWHYTQTLLFYPNLGILMEYQSETGLRIIDGTDMSTTCPAEGFISLRLFDPETEPDLEDLLEPNDNLWRYLPLEEATDMSIEEFFEAYITPGCHTEVITPAELW
jgi:hypothetical protein